MAWIKEILDLRQSSRTKGGNGESDESVKRSPDIDTVAQPGKPGGVLVHCQAGMSRSASIVAAYLMTEFDLDPMEAVAMIRDKRPVIEPSATFWYQLGLFYNTDGKVSLKDRSTRQYYMERTTTQFISESCLCLGGFFSSYHVMVKSDNFSAFKTVMGQHPL